MSNHRAAVFVDGGYLDYVLRSCGAFGKTDFEAFFRALAEPAELLRAYYYHCLPYQSPNPTPEEAARFGAMHRFLDALDQLPRVEVRQGKIAYRGKKADGRPIFVQKQVDSLIATDLVMLSTKRLISEAVVVAGDSDLLPPIRIAKDEGAVVRLAHGTKRDRPHADLWNMADERLPLTTDWFARCRQRELPPDPGA
ncbi:MAG: NYN domain-containing protein [Dehalococcoidia bacterium]|nr:NYN domain-containing protein [Dehalococcoidia bacterium]